MFAFLKKKMFGGLIFAVSSGLVNYLDTHELSLWVFILRFKDAVANFAK